MDKQAVELNQLSRLLFDKAALHWQLSLGLGFASGVIAIIVSLVAPSLVASTVFAVISAIMVIAGYVFRFSFENCYDVAESMRRQSVLSEGLGWPIGRSQFNEWRGRAGGRVLKNAAANPRPDDYYETKEAQGPKKLSAMTYESLFWTKSLYRKMQNYIAVAFILSSSILVIIITIAPLFDFSESFLVSIVYFVYLLIPVLVSIDLVGMFLRLNRAITSLQALDGRLEGLANQPSPNDSELLRLIAEYNCTVATGLPIPGWVFKRHRDEIQACWD